jgi:Tfp pilus assembly protein PilF
MVHEAMATTRRTSKMLLAVGILFGYAVRDATEADKLPILPEDGLVAAQEANDRQREGVWQLALGISLTFRSDPQAASERLNSAVAIATELEDPTLMIAARFARLGASFLANDQERTGTLLAECIQDLQDQLAEATAQGRPRDACIAHLQIGMAMLASQRAAEADVEFRLALDTAREARATWLATAARALGVLPDVWSGHDISDSAYLRKSARTVKMSGEDEGIGLTLAGASLLAHMLGREQQGGRLLRKAVLVFSRSGFRNPVLLQVVGNLYLARHQLDAAASFLETSVEAARTLGRRAQAAESLYLLAQVALERDDRQKAERLGRESLRLYRSIGHSRGNEVSQWVKTKLAIAG